MRHELKRIDGLRKEFMGTFVRFGAKKNFKGYLDTTVLLADIKRCADNRLVCDHLWFNLTKEFDRIGLIEGDIVKFNARVKEYHKGYRGYREDVDDKPVQKDYKLSHPTNVVLIRRNTDDGNKNSGLECS